MKPLKTLILIVFWTLVVILVSPFLVFIGIPVLIIGEIQGRIRWRMLRRRQVGKIYLICTRCNNWYDFINNNLIPSLPDDIGVGWHLQKKEDLAPESSGQFWCPQVGGVSKPYLVVVTRRKLIHKSLNTVLQELKRHPKVSAESRRACAEIVGKAQEELSRMREAAEGG